MHRVPLDNRHVAAAYALSSSAGWNQTEDDWRLLLDLGDTCSGIEVEGQLAATATLICYGQTLGWIGMVLTHSDFRRRGFARALVTHLMERAVSRGIQTVKLDATDFGRELYASVGFREEQTVERWQLQPTHASVPGCRTGDLVACRTPNACGYERSELLERLARHGVTEIEGGYVFHRPGRLNRYLGPCVARTPDTAQTLIEATLESHPDTGWFWDILPANEAATTLARQFGFEPVRTLTRMVWGKELRGKEDQIFAIGGFEFG